MPGTQSLGLAYIGAGAALGVAAGAASALGNKASSKNSTDNAPTINSPNTNGGGYANSYGNMSLTNRLYGRDLLLVIDQQGRVKRR